MLHLGVKGLDGGDDFGFFFLLQNAVCPLAFFTF
jgi:hypothetical protein